MLFDPKWEVETKADPMTLSGLIAWLEKQPAEEEYKWECTDGGCLIGIYGAAMNLGELWWFSFHSMLFDNNQLFIAHDLPHTFGAALSRARRAADAS